MKKIILLTLLLVTGCQILATSTEPVLQITNPPTNTTEINQTIVNETVEEEVGIPVEYSFRYHPNNITLYFPNPYAYIIVTPDAKVIVIDSGNSEQAAETVRTLKDIGFSQADALILSNSKPYRIGGAPLLIERLKPKKGYYSGIQFSNFQLISGFLQDFNQVNKDSIIIPSETVTTTLIVPYDDGEGFSLEEEQNSILTRIRYKEFSVLYASDCYGECEDRTFTDNTQSTIHIMPAEGVCSRNEVSTFFLKTVNATLNLGRDTCPSILAKSESLNQKHQDLNNIAITSDGTSYTLYERR